MWNIGKFLRNASESLTFLCLLLSLASLASYDYLATKEQQAKRILVHYQDSLAASTTLFQALFHELAQDAAFQESIAANYQNALQKTLLTKLRKGQLDYLELFNDKCQSLASASLEKHPPAPCPRDAQLLATPQRDDQTGDLLLSSTYQIRVPDGQKFWMLAQVTVDKNWAQLFPALAADFAALPLAFTFDPQNASFLLEHRESSFAGDQAISLWTNDRFLHLPQQYPEFSLLKTIGVWTFGLLALLLALGRWLGLKKGEFSQRKLWQQVTDRVESLFTSEGLIHNYTPHLDPMLSSHRGALRCMQRIQQQILTTTSKLKLLHDEKSELDARLALLHHQEERWKKDYQQMACFEGLAVQIQASVPGLVNEMGAESERCTEVYLTVKETMLGTCREIMALASSWQENLQQQGSRKFIRSLCEQKSPDSSYGNLLEEQLTTLLDQLQSLFNQGVYLCTTLGEQQKDLNDKTSILRRWYSLAQGGDATSTTSGSSFCGMLFHTLELRRKNPEMAQFSCAQPEGVNELNEIPVPHAPLAAAMAHLIQALALAIPPQISESKLTLRIKTTPEDYFLLFSCSDGDVYHDEQRRQEMWSSIAKVNLLLSRYQISFALLPSNHQLTVFALKWPVVAVQRTPPLRDTLLLTRNHELGALG